jgi:5-methylcytosine-specific restriction enzyme B
MTGRQRASANLDALEFKRQVVLYGPPGTGKTFEAKALARRFIYHQALRRWGPVPYLRDTKDIEEVFSSAQTTWPLAGGLRKRSITGRILASK